MIVKDAVVVEKGGRRRLGAAGKDFSLLANFKGKLQDDGKGKEPKVEDEHHKAQRFR